LDTLRGQIASSKGLGDQVVVEFLHAAKGLQHATAIVARS
jgi:hypothetical protein